MLFGRHLHDSDNPFDGAPAWAVELYAMGLAILKNQETIMAAIDDLAAAVAAEDTVIDSAVVLLNGIPALIAAAGTDPAKLAALQADIVAKTSALAAAVSANTPAPAAGAAPVTPAAASTAAAASVAANPPTS